MGLAVLLFREWGCQSDLQYNRISLFFIIINNDYYYLEEPYDISRINRAVL